MLSRLGRFSRTESAKRIRRNLRAHAAAAAPTAERTPEEDGFRLVHSSYKGFRVYQHSKTERYHVAGLEPRPLVQTTGHRSLNHALSLVDLRHEKTAFLAAGYSPAQWARIERKRELEAEAEVLRAYAPSGSASLDDYRAQRLSDAERQLLELVDAENPSLPPVSTAALAEFGRALQ